LLDGVAHGGTLATRADMRRNYGCRKIWLPHLRLAGGHKTASSASACSPCANGSVRSVRLAWVSVGSCPGAFQRKTERRADDDGHEVPGVARRGAAPVCAGERLRITDIGHFARGERAVADPVDFDGVPLALQPRDGVLCRLSARRGC